MLRDLRPEQPRNESGPRAHDHANEPARVVLRARRSGGAEQNCQQNKTYARAIAKQHERLPCSGRSARWLALRASLPALAGPLRKTATPCLCLIKATARRRDIEEIEIGTAETAFVRQVGRNRMGLDDSAAR